MFKSALCFVYDDVFNEEEIKLIRNYILENKNNFSKATVVGDTPNYRDAWVVHVLSQEISSLILNRITPEIPSILANLNFERFDLIKQETQLTRHGSGGYYKVHTDNAHDFLKDRVLTYVFYFKFDTADFTGGELVLYDHYENEDGRFLSSSSLKVEPLHNRLVIFLSSCFHEVLKVESKSDEFESGRFTINGWLRGKLYPEPDLKPCILNAQKI